MKNYFCVICGKWFDGEPHTDEATGEDCHEKCCTTCHPVEAQKIALDENAGG